jgi:hypothetical protein
MVRRWTLVVALFVALLPADAACAHCVIPAEAGIHPFHRLAPTGWIPACAGMTEEGMPSTSSTEPINPPPNSDPLSPEFSLTVATYVVPDTRDYAQPTLTVDYEWLHVEGRYNYESYDTASLWLGCNFSIGDQLTLDFTPMVGGVFGDVNGVAPGGKLTLGFWKLELYSEIEYLFDTDDHTGNFGYAWSELALAPWEWLRFGLVGQRTNAYDTDVDIQRGLFAGFAYRWLSLTTYVFNLDQSEQTVVVSVAASL